MKRILCSIDFSTSYDQVVKYAAHVAKDTSSKLVLLATHPMGKAEYAGIFSSHPEEVAEGPERLAELCDEIRSIYCVPSDYIDEGGMHIEIKNLIRYTHDADLLVLGVQHDTLSGQLVNSSNIFKILRESTCPVLLIPENYKYHKISRFLYAFDPEKGQEPPFDKLMSLAQWFGSEMRFLSIIRKYSPELEKKMDHDFEAFQKVWKVGKFSFDYVYYDDVPKCLDHYVKTWKDDDVILFTIHTTNMIESLFHKSVVKEIASCASYPILVIHR